MADKPRWGVSLSLAAMGITGTLLGATVQHFYSTEREQNKAVEERQTQGYVALIDAFDKARVSRAERAAGHTEEADKLNKEYQLEVGAAVRRILVFGDKRVVEALARWHQRDNPRPCEASLKPEFETWRAMRETSLGLQQAVDASDLANLAGKCTLTEER